MLEPFMDKISTGNFDHVPTWVHMKSSWITKHTSFTEWAETNGRIMKKPPWEARGVYYPAYTPTGVGEFSSGMIDLERQFLEEINQQRDIPPSILNG